MDKKHTNNLTAKKVIKKLSNLRNVKKEKILRRFFKTGKGEYGEGDIFWGITVPETRAVVKECADISLSEIPALVKHPVHEVRLAGLLLLVQLFPKHPKETYEMYIAHTKYINNWDLVDLSADRIVGAYLENKQKTLLTKFAKSDLLWERRIAMLATFHFIKQGNSEETLRIAKILLHDTHDLMHKAVGWMLREVGKRCDKQTLCDFLDVYSLEMPRTTLRYAIERLPEKKRLYYLKKEKIV